MSTDVDHIRVGEPFMVTVRISMKSRGGGPIVIGRPSVDAYQPPSFDAFTVEDQSSSTRTQIGLSGSFYYHEYITEYNYILRATRPGIHVIKPAAVKVKGQFYESNSLTVKVLPPRTPAPPILEGQTPKPDSTDDVFVQVTADRFTAYVGQPVRVSWYLYTFSRLYKAPKSDLPEAQGFYSKDLLERMKRAGRYEVKHVRIRGRDYVRTLIFRRLYFPMIPGELTIGRREVSFITRRTLNSPISGSAELTRFSAPLKIRVRALPKKGRPPGMTEDIVGHFTIRSTMASSSLKVGDAIDFSVTISGDGLLSAVKNLPIPRLDWASIAANGTPKYEERVVAGKKAVFTLKADYVLVVTKEGRWTFPPIRFSYFDPDREKYVTITTRSRTLKVAPGSGPVPRINAASGTRSATSPSAGHGPASSGPFVPGQTNLLARRILGARRLV